MGYDFYPYVLSIDKLKSFFGSGDEALARKLGEAQEEAGEDGGPSRRQCLLEIAAGWIRHPTHPVPYTMALWAICEHFNEVAELESINSNDLEVGEWPSNGPPIPIPLLEGGEMISVGFFPHDELAAELEQQSGLPPGHFSDERFRAALGEGRLEELRAVYVPDHPFYNRYWERCSAQEQHSFVTMLRADVKGKSWGAESYRAWLETALERGRDLVVFMG